MEQKEAYYETHKAEFTTPEMIRLDVISFTQATAAEQALARLNAGADLGWMREHAEAQIDRAVPRAAAREEQRRAGSR